MNQLTQAYIVDMQQQASDYAYLSRLFSADAEHTDECENRHFALRYQELSCRYSATVRAALTK